MPKPDPTLESQPDSQPKTKDDKRKREPKLGRVYITYTKTVWDPDGDGTTDLTYSGRTSGVVDLTKPIEPQALIILATIRDANHHKTKQGYDIAVLDKYTVGRAVNYDYRYDDLGYWQIRGREQQLIDYFGGAWSDTGKPHKTGNDVRAVAKDNPYGPAFHFAASAKWGEIDKYTGY